MGTREQELHREQFKIKRLADLDERIRERGVEWEAGRQRELLEAVYPGGKALYRIAQVAIILFGIGAVLSAVASIIEFR